MAEQKRQATTGNFTSTKIRSEDDDMPAFHIHSPNTIAEKFRVYGEKWLSGPEGEGGGGGSRRSNTWQ